MSSQRSISAILSTCTTSRCSRNAILRRTRKFQHSKRSFAALAKSQNPLESEEASYGSIVGGLDSANRLEAIRRLLEEDVGGSQLWLTRVKNAQSSLTINRRPSIGVYGGPFSQSQSFVSALLQDPLEIDPLIDERHVDSNAGVLEISYGTTAERKADSLISTSSWLGESGVIIREINRTEATHALDHLIPNDINVLVLDPLYLLSAPGIVDVARAILPNCQVLLVVNGPLPPGESESDVAARLDTQLSHLLSTDSLPPPTIFVDAARAASAIRTFAQGVHSEPSISARANSVEIFQHDYEASRVGTVKEYVISKMRSGTISSTDSTGNTIRMALAYLQDIARAEQTANNEARQTIQVLRSRAERSAQEAKHLSVVSRGIDGGMVEGGVDHSLSVARKGIEDLFKARWSWLNLIFKARADEVGTEMRAYVEGQFGKDLERSLVFEAGQLSQIQKALSQETDVVLQNLAGRTSSQHALSSPVLINHLKTLTISIPPFESTTLLSPVTLRKRQLMTESVARLQASVQRILISNLSLATSGVGLAWAVCMPPLGLLSTTTAVGCGLVGILTSLALGQRWWGKSQKRFWSEWHRITAMLHGDLRDLLAEVVHTRLIAKPQAAADGLEEIIARREKRVQNMLQAIKSLKQ